MDASMVDLPHDLLQAVHILEDVGDTELPSLAGGDVLRTVKIISKEVRLSSKVAKAGMERLCNALTSVSIVCLPSALHSRILALLFTLSTDLACASNT